MNTGIKGEKKFTVTKEQLACNVGSGLVSVFATPMMIAAIENTAAGSVRIVKTDFIDRLRRTSCDVRLFASLYGYSSGTSVSMNGTSVLYTSSIALDICWIRYCRGDVPTFLTNRLIRLPLVE